MMGFRDIPAELSMWDNPLFEELYTFEDSIFWKQKGIVAMEQVYQSGNICSFDYLKTQYKLVDTFFYRFLQLRHALSAQFGSKSIDVSRFPLIGIL